MNWRFFPFSLVFLAAACIFAPRIQRVEAAGDGYPAHVSATLNGILEQAHKKFRKDAVITGVEVQGVPAFYWLQVSLYSPSNGATLTVWIGGPQDGQFSVGSWKPQDDSQRALPTNFSVDLPDAMGNLRKAGLTGPLGVTRLVWTGASGTPQILAWSIRVAGGPIMFPLFINAQDGKAIPWQRAMDPPRASDAELRDIWDRLLNRNQGKPYDPGEITPFECMAIIQAGGFCVGRSRL